MAKYDASINLLVTGQQKVEALLSSVDRLQGAIGSLRSKPVDLNIKNYNDQLEQGQKRISSVDQKINKLYGERLDTIEKIFKLNERITQKDKIISESTSTTTKKYQEAVRIKNNAIQEQTKLQEKLNESIDQSNKLSGVRSSLVGNQESIRALRQQVGFARTLANSYLELGDARKYAEGRGFGGRTDLVKNNTSIAQIKEQAANFELLANNTRIASQEFNRYIVASQLASQKAGKAKLEQLSVLAEAFSASGQTGIKPRFSEKEIAGARSSVSSLIGSYGGIVKSEAALSAYADQLRTIQSLVPYTSNEFRALEEAIAAVDKELSAVGNRGQNTAIKVISGPATDLGSLKAFQQRESYQKRVDDQLAKQASIEDRINRANISDSQKLELRNQLESAAVALSEDQLTLAQRLSREIDRQRMSMERANRSRDLVVGTLGQGFMPVSGRIPGVGIEPGSPADKQRTTKAKLSWQGVLIQMDELAQQIEQTAAAKGRKIQMDWNLALEKANEILSDATLGDLQAGTKAATKLGQQRLKEIERATADLWKGYGGPALPPGFTEKGRITPKATGQFSPIEGQRRLTNIVESGAIVKQGLINLQGRGADVTNRLVQLETALNSAKQNGYEISQKNLDTLNDEVASAGRFAQLQRQILAGQERGINAKNSDKGYKAALSTEEARAKIEEITKNFNNAVSSGASTQNIGENVASSFAENLKSGATNAASAATSFASAALKAIKKVFGIASPSRVMQEIASNLISSFITELIANIPSVKAALEKTFDPKAAYEQAANAPERRPGMAMQLDPKFVAALSGNPLPSGVSAAAGTFDASYSRPSGMGLYRMQQRRFPVVPPAELSAPQNQLSDANKVVSEAIKEYRAAVDNFWEGEDSQFQAITRILVSSTRLGVARFSRRLSQGRSISPEQQFQQQFDQVASQARFAISAGQRSSSFQNISAEKLKATLQSLSDSILNSAESLSYSISDSFRDQIGQIKDRVGQAIASGLSEMKAGLFASFSMSGGAGGGGRPPAPPSPPTGPNNDDLRRALNTKNLAPLAAATNEQLALLEEELSAVRNGLARTNPLFDQLSNQIQALGREQERRAPGASFLTRRFGPRTANAISEGLIGGAFPVLFGQGLGASAGGLVGGAAGGFAGGGLGFGLSLLGTALGSAFDQLSKAAEETGKSLRYPIEGFDQLKQAGLFASKEQEFYIQKLINSGKAAEAAAAIQNQIISKIGPQGVNDLNRLGKASDELSKAWANLYLEIQAALAGPLTGLLEWVRSIVQASTGGIQKQAFAVDPNAFRAAEEKAKAKASGGNIFSGLLPRYNEKYMQELNRLSEEIIAKNAAKLPKVKPAGLTPDDIERNRQAAEELANQIRDTYREGFKIQRQSQDIERSIADNKKKVADDIYQKQQEAAKLEINNARTAAQIRIDATDLALRKSFAGAEGDAATILRAVTEEIKVRASGQADIEQKRRELEITLADIQKQTNDYIYEQSKVKIQLERQIEDYKMDVADYQLKVQRLIQEEQRKDQAAAASGAVGIANIASTSRTPREKALLATIRFAEGTAGPAGYQTMFGGGTFSDMSHHPNRVITAGGYSSAAAGAYQFMPDTWNRIGGGAMTPQRQDAGAIALALGRNANINTMQFTKEFVNKLAPEWASFPNLSGRSVYNQPVKSFEALKAYFDRALAQFSGTQQSASPIFSWPGQGASSARAPGANTPQAQFMDAGSGVGPRPQFGGTAVDTTGMEKAQQGIMQLKKNEFELQKKINDLNLQGALYSIQEAARGDSNNTALANQLDLEQKRTDLIKNNIGAGQNQLDVINKQLEGEKQIDLIQTYSTQAIERVNDAKNKGVMINGELVKLSKQEADAIINEIVRGTELRVQNAETALKLEKQILIEQQQAQFSQKLSDVARETALANIGIKFGYIGKAAEAFREGLDLTGSVAQAQQLADAVQRLQTLPGGKLYSAYNEAATSLQDLATWENVAVTGASAIGDAFGSAFRDIATGTASAQEILAGFFRNLANSFADMAGQMLTDMIKLLFYKQLLGVFGLAAPGAGAAASAAPLLDAGPLGATLGGFPAAAKGAYFSGNTAMFAKGGVVSSPTLFKFADGGTTKNGVMGEAGPEAILPLSRGSNGKLGVSASGGGTTNVTVNVDASGSKAQGDSQHASQLGKAVASAVQEELLRQKRPGGLLA